MNLDPLALTLLVALVSVPDGRLPTAVDVHREDVTEAAQLAEVTGATEGASPSETGEESEVSAEPEPDDEGAIEEPRIWYDEVVVTATRGERAAGRVPLFSTIVDRATIESAPDIGVVDLMRQIPSVNFSVDAPHLMAQPRQQGFTMRGLGGPTQSRALALVDGLPMIDPYGGFVIWSQVPKEFVERVEVVRGGGSGVWGNLALTGVVNLITRPATERSFRGTVRAGSRSTRSVAASYSDRSELWSGWIGGDYFDTDGFQDVHPDERVPGTEPSNRQYESLTGKLTRTFSTSTLLTLRGSYYDEEREEGTSLDRGRTEERWLAGSLDSVRTSGASWQLRLFDRNTFAAEFNGSTPVPNQPQTPLSHIYDVSSDALGVGGVWHSAARGRHSLTSGADFQYTSIERREALDWDGTRFTTDYFVAGRQRLGGLFAEDDFAVSDRLSVLVAARFDVIETYDGESVRTDLSSGQVVRRDRLENNTETSFNPSLGFVYAATPSSRVRGAVYRGFRGAMPSELFVGNVARRRVTQPNPGLAPETLRGVEAGYDYTPSAAVSARFTVFWNEIDDLIQRVTTGTAPPGGGEVPPCGFVSAGLRCSQRRNLGQVRSSGLEVETAYRPTPAWQLVFSGIWLEGEVTENPIDPALVGNRLSRAPEKQVAFSLTYRSPKRWRALARARYVGDAFDDVENEEYMPSYRLVDLSVAQRLGERWEVFAGVENLFDESYIISIASAGTLIGGPRLYHLGLRFSG